MSAPRRRYTKKQKAAAVALALTVNPLAASEGTGIPRTTILGWIDKPEYDSLRQKTQEEMSEGYKVLANLAMQRLLKQIEDDEVDPKDVAVAMGIATDKYLLMTGHATARTETVNITDDLPAEVKRQLRGRLARSVRGESDASGAEGDPGGAGEPVDPAAASGTAV